MPANPLTKVLYTAEAITEGGRAGHSRTADGRLDLELSVPEDMGGPGGPGTNPEQLFAVGYGACFQSALLGVAQGRHLDASDSVIPSRDRPDRPRRLRPASRPGPARTAPLARRGRGPDGPRGPALPVLQRHPRQRPGHPQRRRKTDRVRRLSGSAVAPVRPAVARRTHPCLEQQLRQATLRAPSGGRWSWRSGRVRPRGHARRTAPCWRRRPAPALGGRHR
jgi:hypothetical protein